MAYWFTFLNTKIKEVESKITDVSGLVTTTALNKKIKEVQDKVIGLLKKTDYDAKIPNIDK